MVALLGKLQALFLGKKSWLGILVGALAFAGGQFGGLSPDQVETGFQVGGLIFGAGITAKAARVAKALAS